jgi:hypothetical protein
MTATTATWAIPYATGTDRLCDAASITESMARRVDDIMFAFDADVTFLHDIPAARISWTSPSSLQQAQTGGCTSPIGILYNTADYDTDNMVNLSVDTTIITYRRPGYFSFGGSNQYSVPPLTNNQSMNMNVFSLVPVSAVCGQSGRDNGTDFAAQSCSALNFIAAPRPVGSEIEIDTELCRGGTTGAGVCLIVQYSNMYAHWIREV